MLTKEGTYYGENFMKGFAFISETCLFVWDNNK